MLSKLSGGGEMVLVNISSLAGPISLKMHILIVSNESRWKIVILGHFDQFGPKKGPKMGPTSHFETEYTNFHNSVQT